jgi:plastocyanin
MKINVGLLLITLVLSVVLLMGCSSSGYVNLTTTSRAPTATTSSTAVGTGQVAVSIAGFAFSPQAVTVSKGATVTWTNNDSTTHTITSDNGIWDSGEVAPGKTFSRTFNDTGTFPYHCIIHVTMKAQVVVQ